MRGKTWDLLNGVDEAQQARSRTIFIGEDGGPGDQNIGPRARGEWCGLDVNTAIRLQLTLDIALLQ